MCAEPDGDFFLCAAMEWAALRASNGVGPGLAGLYRELAFCHLLFKRGKYAAVLARLRAVLGLNVRNTGRTPDRAETLAIAADILSTLRLRLAA